jgi:hypothetical protein
VPSRAQELNPVENAWQYLRQNWLAVFEHYDAIVDAICDARNKLPNPKPSPQWGCESGPTSVRTL